MSQTDGYAALVAARAPALLRLAVMLTGDRTETENLLQSTFVRTQRHADRISAMAAPGAYLRTAMLREHISGVRRLARGVRTTPLAHHHAAAARPDTEWRDAAWRLLTALPRQPGGGVGPQLDNAQALLTALGIHH